MGEAGKGMLAMIGAATIWGLSPLYYKQLAHVPPLEVLSHRTLWSFVIFFVLLAGQGRLREFAHSLKDRRAVFQTALAGGMIALNWFVFILSVQTGHTVEASLGYYIFPLVAVALGALVLGERLSVAQWLAVALAALAVVVLTLGLGVTPWIALILSVTFGIYGLIKKRMAAGPVLSVTGEVLLLLPLALIWLAGVNLAGWVDVTARAGGYFGNNLHDTFMLFLAGLITAGPLILMSYAARRLTLSTVGLLQYLNPTLQFMVAVLVFRELFTAWHGFAFALIWAALVIYSSATWRREKLRRREAARSSMPDTTDM
ncbi:MAG: EamA family transporter RarD [Rhodobacteraceae bacterium]|nr:EamA family transporter RarD [Paracoccaceae bacterium]